MRDLGDGSTGPYGTGAILIHTLTHVLCVLIGCSSGQLIGSASASVFSGEEQFEDYGEGEDVDYTPSSPCPDDDVRTNGFSDLGSSLPSRLVVHRGNSHSIQDIHQ